MKSESCDYVRVLNAELQYVSIEVTRGTRFDISSFNKQLNEVIRDAQSNHLFVTFRLRQNSSSSTTSQSLFFSTNIYYTYFKSNAATSF